MHSFYKLFHRNIWLVSEKAIPLHPLSRSNDISSKCERDEAKQEANKEKEFFEKDLHKTEK